MAIDSSEQRDKAWNIRAYPCIGLGVFLVPYISFSPAYSKVLERLKAGSIMLDVGCFIGADFRRLAYDGAPTDKMYGVDIVSHWDLGYELYRDRDRFNAKIIISDILFEDNPELEALKGKVDVISVSAVMHQWTWDKQVEAAKRIVAFSSGKDSIIFGHQVGHLEGRDVTLPQATTFRHNAESQVRLWKQVGEETATKWNCQARLMDRDAVGWDPKDLSWMDPGDRVLDYVVTRLE